MLLVLLEPVNRADFKYVCIFWIGRQIWKIYEKTLTITHICPMYKMFLISSKGSRMINLSSISMILVLLEPVNRADFKYRYRL